MRSRGIGHDMAKKSPYFHALKTWSNTPIILWFRVAWPAISKSPPNDKIFKQLREMSKIYVFKMLKLWLKCILSIWVAEKWKSSDGIELDVARKCPYIATISFWKDKCILHPTFSKICTFLLYLKWSSKAIENHWMPIVLMFCYVWWHTFRGFRLQTTKGMWILCKKNV